MVKSLVVLAIAAAVLSTTGCCWPLYEGRYHRYDRDDRYSDGSRPAPRARPGRDDGRDRGYRPPGW
jgi:hypothetical protein